MPTSSPQSEKPRCRDLAGLPAATSFTAGDGRRWWDGARARAMRRELCSVTRREERTKALKNHLQKGQQDAEGLVTERDPVPKTFALHSTRRNRKDCRGIFVVISLGGFMEAGPARLSIVKN